MTEPQMAGTAQTEVNPDRYARMSVPFESKEDLDAAVRRFYEDVGASRERNKITDVIVVHLSYYKREDGRALPGIGSFSYGDSHLRSTLAGWLYEQESAFFRHLTSGVFNRSAG